MALVDWIDAAYQHTSIYDDATVVGIGSAITFPAEGSPFYGSFVAKLVAAAGAASEARLGLTTAASESITARRVVRGIGLGNQATNPVRLLTLTPDVGARQVWVSSDDGKTLLLKTQTAVGEQTLESLLLPAAAALSDVWLLLEVTANDAGGANQYGWRVWWLKDVGLGDARWVAKLADTTNTNGNIDGPWVGARSQVVDGASMYCQQLVVDNTFNADLGPRKIVRLFGTDGDDVVDANWQPSLGGAHSDEYDDTPPDDDATFCVNQSTAVNVTDSYHMDDDRFPTDGPASPVLAYQAGFRARNAGLTQTGDVRVEGNGLGNLVGANVRPGAAYGTTRGNIKGTAGYTDANFNAFKLKLVGNNTVVAGATQDQLRVTKIHLLAVIDFALTVTETLAVAEVVTDIAVTASVAETIPETPTVAALSVTLSVAEEVALVEAASVAVSFTLTETIDVAEVLTQIDVTLSVAETVALAEVVAAIEAELPTLLEEIGVAEATQIEVSLTLEELIAVTEVARAVIVGPIPFFVIVDGRWAYKVNALFYRRL